VWTLNRSPHGNKTAREQFGRQVWQRRVKRTKEDGLTRRKQARESKNQYVRGKEIQTQTLDNEREKNQ
jgi:ribosomal protein S10